MTIYVYRVVMTALVAVLGLTVGVGFCVAASDHYEDVAEKTTTTLEGSVRYTQANWHTSAPPVLETFVVTDTGDVYGTTSSGVPFTQVTVMTSSTVRVQKFVIQDHYHYVVAGQVVYAEADMLALVAELEAVAEAAKTTTPRDTDADVSTLPPKPDAAKKRV